MATNFANFYTAQDARQIAIGQRSSSNDILTEINILELAIDQGAAAGELVVPFHYNSTLTFDTVTITGSPMTVDAGNVYYNAFADPNTYYTSQYLVANEKMNQVISYFSTLGFSIKRYRDGVLNQFYWSLNF